MLALAGSVTFSGKAIIVKLVYRHGVDAVTAIMCRMLFALPLFLLMSWLASRGKPALQRRDWASVLALGFSGYYLSSYLDFLGLQYVSASLERLIMYLTPTLVLMFAWLFHGRRVNARQWLAMAVSYCGVLLVFGHELKLDGRLAAWGALLILGSTISYALYLVYSEQVVQRLGSVRLVGLATSVACVLCVLQYFLLRPVSDLAQIPGPVLGLSVVNATLCTALPVLLVMMAIERIGPALTSQAGMIGPMATIAMGVLILDEPMNRWILAGTVLVLSGVFMVSRNGGK